PTKKNHPPPQPNTHPHSEPILTPLPPINLSHFPPLPSCPVFTRAPPMKSPDHHQENWVNPSPTSPTLDSGDIIGTGNMMLLDKPPDSDPPEGMREETEFGSRSSEPLVAAMEVVDGEYGECGATDAKELPIEEEEMFAADAEENLVERQEMIGA
ncbi:hypothetical protein PIB30_094613, partial [Stylosanthes scabra]|nr:hypothetical protein [Stylosanthes scabra]